jgi:hypothetical protein
MRLTDAGPHHAFRVLDLSREDAETRRRTLAQTNADVQSSFDLERGPCCPPCTSACRTAIRHNSSSSPITS